MDDPYWDDYDDIDDDDDDWDDEDYCPGCGQDSYWCECDEDDEDDDDDWEPAPPPHKHVYAAWGADPRFGRCACGDTKIIS